MASIPPKTFRGSCRSVQRGFTLIEMLVVVTIIMLLVSMLLPAFKKPRNKCQANLRALVMGYQNYARENRRLLMGSNTGEFHDWIGDGNNMAALQSGKMWPYVQAAEFYQCPQQVYPSYLNSYSVNGRLNGEQKNAGDIGSSKNWTKRNWSSNMRDDQQMVFMEEDDHRGWNINSFMLGATQGKFIDLVPANHDNGDNLAFLDGHVEGWTWKDKDLLIRPKHRPVPTFGFNDPGNEDWDRLNPVFMTWPK